MRQASLEPRLEYVTCASPAGLHRMAYWEWGDPANDQVLVCVHGLTRTGRDFDALAQRLAGRYRVVCPDVVGRGRSDWLANPAFYTVPQYAADMVTLIARLKPARLAWVGTSMGGLIGMALSGSAAFSRAAAAMRPHPGMPPAQEGLHFDRMVLNDVGPGWKRAGPHRPVRGHAARVRFLRAGGGGDARRFAAVRAAQRRAMGAAGPLRLSRAGRALGQALRPGAGAAAGRADPAGTGGGEQLLWQCYVGTDCPVLIVRGEQSDLLTTVTVDEMLQRNPRARAVVIPGVGHAPTLMSDAQIEPVAAFLLD